jgi:hypothetical protein
MYCAVFTGVPLRFTPACVLSPFQGYALWNVIIQALTDSPNPLLPPPLSGENNL